jgi:ABC-2 type transport system ATP-binding protein
VRRRNTVPLPSDKNGRRDVMDPALEIRDVCKSFGATRAIDELTLAIPRGATYGLIGPSGAGKTTAIRMIMSILFPDSGTLRVLGRPSALEAKHRIGYLPEERGTYRRMRVDGFLTYIGRLKGGTARGVRQRAAHLLTRLGLAAVGAHRCEDLSKGMLQRVQFVAAIINEPELLILDEPFSGLDPVSVRLLKEIIAEEQARGASIIFSTHVMAHAEELCQQIVMIHKGRKVLDEPITGLRRRYDTRTILLEPLHDSDNLLSLQSVAGVERVRLTDEGCEIGLAAGCEPAAAMRALAAAIPLARLELARVRLEDVFIRLVTGGGATEPGAQALRTHLQGLNAEGATS